MKMDCYVQKQNFYVKITLFVIGGEVLGSFIDGPVDG